MTHREGMPFAQASVSLPDKMTCCTQGKPCFVPHFHLYLCCAIELLQRCEDI